MNWSFSYDGPLAGMKQALDDREGPLGGLSSDSLSAFKVARPLLEAQANSCATASGVSVHAHGSAGVEGNHAKTFFVDVKSVDSVTPVD